MNIFTNDDYRRIQAWLKANAIKDSDFAISEDTVPDEDILVITQNMSTVPTNYKIKIKDLLNSSLGKVVINKITANIVKVNNSLTIDASKVILNNEKGTTLQDVFNYFEEGKLNRHTDDTFDGNLTVKKNITIEGNIKSHDDTITVEADLEATGEITDGQGNMLSDVNDASKGWRIEYQDPQQDEPTVRAKYVLKDYRGVPKGNVIKIYKDSAITNVYLGTVEDTCNLSTGEVTKHPIHDNNEALSIVYRLDTGKYSLVNVPIKMFVTEAEFDKYRGLGITENGQVFIKLASDIESSNYLHFNELGEITADGIETRILKDLGNIITSVAGDRTMWGQYKKEEGTKDSPINEASRWGQYKQAEADRSGLLNVVSSKVNQIAEAVSNERSERTSADAELLKRIIGKSSSSSAYTDPFKYLTDYQSEKDASGKITKHATRVMQDALLETLRHSDYRDSFPYIGHMRAHVEGVPIEIWTYVKTWNTGSTNGVFVQVVRTNFGLNNGVISSALTESFHEYYRTVTVGMANGSVTDVTATTWKESTVTKELYRTIADNKNKLSDLESEVIYDVSAHNDGAVFESLSSLLSSSNLDTLIPTSVRKGGMTIRFIQSSDNKYVQYRLMSPTWSTAVANWQGVDDTPIVESQNLITSGGVKDESINLSKEIGSKMLELTPAWEVRYCYLTDTIGNIPTQTPNGNFKCVKLSVKEGEQYIIQGKGGDTYRLWAITGEDEKVISHANVSEYNTQIVNIGLDGFLYVNIYGLNTDARIWLSRSGISANIYSLEESIKLYHSIFKAAPINLNVLPLDLLLDFEVTNRLPNRLYLIEVKVTSIRQYLTIHFTTESAPRTIVSSQNLKNVDVFDTGVCRYSRQDADGETLSIIIDWDKIHEGDIFRYYPDEYIVKDAVYSGGILSSYLFPIKDKSIGSAKLTDDAFDSTLTQERKIADAKAVGDALREAGKLTEELQGVFPVNTYGERYWAVCGDSITSANHAKNGQFLIDGIEDNDPYCPIDGYSKLNSYKRKNYAYYFAKEHTIKWANYGYGGTTLSHCPSIGHPLSQIIPFVDSRIENLKEGIDWNFISIFFGYNDFMIGPIAEREKWLKTTYGFDIRYPETSAQIGQEGFATAEQKNACDAVTGSVGGIEYTDNEAYFFAKFFGLIDDSTKESFLGAYNYAIEYLMRKYTKAKIMIVAPFFSKYKELFTTGIHTMADKWGVTCFDFTDVPFWYMNPVHQQMTFLNAAEGSGGYWYTETGVGLPRTLDGYNMSRYSTDSLHPTNLGYRLLAEMFGNKMLNG